MKCVYCLDFPDGKRYVGSTKDLKKRMSIHRCPGTNKSNPELREAITAGGYSVVILEQCPDKYTKKQLEAREQHYINLWFDYGILYNKYKIARGGSKKGRPSPNKGRPSPHKNIKRSMAYQRADEIKADRISGMSYVNLRNKYKTSVNVVKDILSTEP